MTKVKIVVTDQHIAKSFNALDEEDGFYYKATEDCPIAQALLELTQLAPGEVQVSYDTITIGGEVYYPDKGTKRFIEKWDNHRIAHPIELYALED